MDAVAEAEGATPPCCAGSHVLDRGLDGLDPVGPHEEHVGGRGGAVARGLGQTPEVERRTMPGDGADARRLEL